MTDNMLDFISKTLRRHMVANTLSFTDFEKAGLIYSSPLLPEEMHRRLDALTAEAAGREKSSGVYSGGACFGKKQSRCQMP